MISFLNIFFMGVAIEKKNHELYFLLLINPLDCPQHVFINTITIIIIIIIIIIIDFISRG